MLLGACFLFGERAHAEELDAAESLSQKWTVDEGRVSADAELSLRGEVGDTYRLLSSEVTLKEFAGEGLRLLSDEQGYFVTIIELPAEPAAVPGAPVRDPATGEYPEEREPEVVEDTGERTGVFSYEIRQKPGEVRIPTGIAAAHVLEVTLNKSGWSISCEKAAQITESEVEGASVARIDSASSQ